MNKIFRALACSMLYCVTSLAWSQSTEPIALYSGDDRQARMEEGAKKEGALVFYTTIPTQYAKDLIEPFEKKYGIKVETWRARSELIQQRVINEARSGRPKVDIIASTSPPMEALHREGLLQKVETPRFGNLIDEAIPEHREWVSINLLTLVQAYNTRAVKKEDLPKTYEDLLDPKWKGKLAIEGSDYDWMASVVHDMGDEKGTQFFKDLVAKNQLSVRNGHPLLTNLVGSGEVPLALTVYDYSVEQAKKTGAPIEWFAIEPAVTITIGMGILKDAPHPNAAMLFYDYLLGEEAQRVLREIGYYATNKKIDPPFENVKLKILDPGTVLDEQEEAYRRFESVIQNVR